MAFIRCDLSGGGVKIAWVKIANHPNTITSENCDYMICASSRTNLANDVLREVLNAKLIKSENVSGSYDVALYNGVTSATTIKQIRQYSQTIVIGIDVGLEDVKANTQSGYIVGALALKEAIGTTLDGTLAAGATSISFTDAAITDESLIDVYTDLYGVNPSDIDQDGSTLTLTFDAQTNDIRVLIKVQSGVM